MYEWTNEPDFVEFEYAGLKCKIIRQGEWSGHLCGYVQVPKEHPWFEVSYDDIEVEVHGGLTFGGTLKQDPDNYYFGFDCAHYMDLQPARVERGEVIWDGTYRNVDYVTKECKSLAEQISKANVPELGSDKAFKAAFKVIQQDYHSDREMCKLAWDAALHYERKTNE